MYACTQKNSCQFAIIELRIIHWLADRVRVYNYHRSGQTLGVRWLTFKLTSLHRRY